MKIVGCVVLNQGLFNHVFNFTFLKLYAKDLFSYYVHFSSNPSYK